MEPVELKQVELEQEAGPAPTLPTASGLALDESSSSVSQGRQDLTRVGVGVNGAASSVSGGAAASRPAALHADPFVQPPAHELLHSTAVVVGLRTDADAVAGLRAAAKAIRRAARHEPSANVSNVGGWQSRADFLMDEKEVLTPLYPIVYDAILEYLVLALPAALLPTAATLDLRLTGWANANRQADSNAIHDHVDQDWALSGVLYLDDAGDDECGLTFANPIPADARRPGARPIPEAPPPLATPRPGRTLVFPSWLPHWVPALCAMPKRQRLSVAFNAAALLPLRVWPDGEPARGVPNLSAALETARVKAAERMQRWSERERVSADTDGASRAATPSGRTEAAPPLSKRPPPLEDAPPPHVHRLWPLHVTRARVAAAVGMSTPLDLSRGGAPAGDGRGVCRLRPAVSCCVAVGTLATAVGSGGRSTFALPHGCPACDAVGDDGDGDASEVMGGGRPLAAWLHPIIAIVQAHAAHVELATSVVNVTVCAFSPTEMATAVSGPVGALPHAAPHALAAGLFFPPSPFVSAISAEGADEEKERCDASATAERSSQRQLVLTDERIAAGDLASHIAMRHRDAQGGRMPQVDHGQQQKQQQQQQQQQQQRIEDNEALHPLESQPLVNGAGGGLAAPDGSIFTFSPWARPFVDEVIPSAEAQDATASSGCQGESPLPWFLFEVLERHIE